MKMLTLLSVLLTLLSVAPVLFAQETPPTTSQPDEQQARERAIERAKAWLHEKLNLAPEKMKLESAVTSTWPDTALGCPEKGHMYAQMVTNGWTVILKVGGKTHEVHVSGRRAVGCDSSQAKRKLKNEPR